MMNRQELTDHIVHRLSDSAGRNNLVREVCIKGDLSWTEAEALVNEVAASQSRTIARRRYPLLLAISVVTMLAGLALVVSTIIWVYELMRPTIELGGVPSLAMVFFILSSHAPLLEQAVFGVAMMIGATIGLYWAAASM